MVKDLDECGDVLVPEAGPHDIELWPHLHAGDLQDRLFPIAVAVPEVECISDEERKEVSNLHRRWAAHRIAATCG